MLVFGGTDFGLLARDDLYALDLAQDPPAWLKIEPGLRRPPSLLGMAATYSHSAEMAIFHGGQTANPSEPTAWGLRCLPAGVRIQEIFLPRVIEGDDPEDQ